MTPRAEASDKAATGSTKTGAPKTAPPADLPGEKAFNSCVRIPARRRVKVNLKQGTDLHELVSWISAMTCKKFIVGSTLRSQKVTLISPTAISAAEAYRAFLSALDVMGLTVVASGRYLKVVQSNWAIQSAIPTYSHAQRRRTPASDAVVTQLLQVREASVSQLLPVLAKMKSRSGDVMAYAPSNTLIITDSGANVRRMVGIVEQLDKRLPGQTELWLVRLRHADASELSKLIGELFGAGKTAGASAPRKTSRRPGGAAASAGGAADATRVLVDTASNALVIVASAPVFARMKAVIEKVDVESGTRPAAWVYRLKHSKAEQLAQVLSGVTGGSSAASRTRGRGRSRARARVKSAAAPDGLFDGAVQISPDKTNNSLLIMATTRDYLNLRRMIRALDQPRRQVFVEAYIMEVSVDKDRDVGFGYHNGALIDGQTTVIGGVAHSGLNSAALNPIGLMGLAAMVQGPLIQGSAAALGLDTGDLPAFGIVFQAMQADTNVNMLSSPHLLTTDNEEARIQVGENIPLRSGTSSLPAASGADAGQLSMLASYTQPVRYKDVGIELKLTPTIGDGDTISLKLEQEVSNVASEDFAGLGAKMAQRKLSTVVTVQDQQTVVIGGLIREEERTEESKVPLLGDIPILGRFFRRDLTKKYKTNLLVVLTPYIIRGRSDLRRIFKQKLEERKEFIRRYTAFKDNAKLDRINFSSKRGLLAEIDAVGRNAERETALKKAARPAKRTALEVVRMSSK